MGVCSRIHVYVQQIRFISISARSSEIGKNVLRNREVAEGQIFSLSTFDSLKLLYLVTK